MSLNDLPRLVYLAEEHRIGVPAALSKLLPQGDLLREISTSGMNQTVLNLGLPEKQLMKLYDEGAHKRNGRIHSGDAGEFRILVGKLATEELELKREDLPLREYLKTFRLIDDFVSGKSSELVERSEFSMGDDHEEVELPKFDSGFEPVDIVTNGLYQGIVTIVGKPGHGKTSLMLALMEMIRHNQLASSMWFYEVEIPAPLMLWKTQSMRKRTDFLQDDIVRCGMFSTQELLDRMDEYPDQDRIIFLDGPDAMAAGTGGDRRFGLEEIYRDLILMKDKSKMIVVSSQARRKDETIVLESGAESWQKAWYSDIMIGTSKVGRSGRDSRIKLNCIKNRFGLEGRELKFTFDMSDLSWSITETDRLELEEEEW